MTEPCPPNSFRELWLPPFQAGDCSSCGNGVSLDMTVRITVFHFNGTTSLMPVGTTSEDCCECLGEGAAGLGGGGGGCRAWVGGRTVAAVY